MFESTLANPVGIDGLSGLSASKAQELHVQKMARGRRLSVATNACSLHEVKALVKAREHVNGGVNFAFNRTLT
jgi:hypothetical protein